MFGLLLGTLKKFKTESKTQEVKVKQWFTFFKSEIRDFKPVIENNPEGASRKFIFRSFRDWIMKQVFGWYCVL